MEELTPVSIGTIASSMKLSAKFCFVIWRQMNFFMKFVISMCEGAIILKLAFPGQLPISAHFCLKFYLVLLNKVIPFLLRFELLFWSLDCCSFVEFISLIVSPRGVILRLFSTSPWPQFMVIFSKLRRSIRIVVKWLFSWRVASHCFLLWNL